MRPNRRALPLLAWVLGAVAGTVALRRGLVAWFGWPELGAWLAASVFACVVVTLLVDATLGFGEVEDDLRRREPHAATGKIGGAAMDSDATTFRVGDVVRIKGSHYSTHVVIKVETLTLVTVVTQQGDGKINGQQGVPVEALERVPADTPQGDA